jgi:hypothetical protein
MSEKELAELIDRAAGLPEQCRREWEARLPFDYAPTYGAGVVQGLVTAAALVSAVSQEAARHLRDGAAVAATRLVEQRKLYREVDCLTNTPQARAEIEAEVERIMRGEVQMHPLDDLLREMGILPDKKGGQGDAPSSKAS